MSSSLFHRPIFSSVNYGLLMDRLTDGKLCIRAYGALAQVGAVKWLSFQGKKYANPAKIDDCQLCTDNAHDNYSVSIIHKIANYSLITHNMEQNMNDSARISNNICAICFDLNIDDCSCNVSEHMPACPPPFSELSACLYDCRKTQDPFRSGFTLPF